MHTRVAAHADARHGQFFQGTKRFFRAVLLRKSEQHVQDNDGTNRDAVAIVTEKYGNHGGGDEDKHHEGGQLFPNNQPRTLEPVRFEFIASIVGESLCGFWGRQSQGAVGLEPFEDNLRVQFMPVGRGSRGIAFFG